MMRLLLKMRITCYDRGGDGNDELYRFLNIADGVAKAQGRKVIFSSNLPHLREVDDALIRPGRCFARLHVRNLTREEAKGVAMELCRQQGKNLQAVMGALEEAQGKTLSLAEVYKAMGIQLRVEVQT